MTLRDGLQLTAKAAEPNARSRSFANCWRWACPHWRSARWHGRISFRRWPIRSTSSPRCAPMSSHTAGSGWRPRRHVEKAAAAGARNFQYCFSASDSHNQANIGRTTEDSARGDARCRPDRAGRRRRDSVVHRDRVHLSVRGAHRSRAGDRHRRRPAHNGADDIVVCDTIGQAIPTQVTDLIEGLKVRSPQRRIVFHGHDTWGLGVANTLAAIDAGATMVDGSLGGLGGCPFAPGASGNTSSEDLLFATRPALVHAGHACVDGGHHRQAPRRTRRAESLPELRKAHGRRPRHSTGSSAVIRTPDGG